MAKTSFTIAELAQRWNINSCTIGREIKRGRLEAFKVGKLWRVKASEVRRYERENTAQAASLAANLGRAAVAC